MSLVIYYIPVHVCAKFSFATFFLKIFICQIFFSKSSFARFFFFKIFICQIFFQNFHFPDFFYHNSNIIFSKEIYKIINDVNSDKEYVCSIKWMVLNYLNLFELLWKFYTFCCHKHRGTDSSIFVQANIESLMWEWQWYKLNMNDCAYTVVQ